MDEPTLASIPCLALKTSQQKFYHRQLGSPIPVYSESVTFECLLLRSDAATAFEDSVNYGSRCVTDCNTAAVLLRDLRR